MDCLTEDKYEDDAAEAFAAISAQIETWGKSSFDDTSGSFSNNPETPNKMDDSFGNENAISPRRLSGTFSRPVLPVTYAASSRTEVGRDEDSYEQEYDDNDRVNVDFETPGGRPKKDQVISSGDYHFSSFRSSPIETPPSRNFLQSMTSNTASSGLGKKDQILQEIEEEDEVLNYSSVSKEESDISQGPPKKSYATTNSDYTRLYGDYDPYYSALQTMLHAREECEITTDQPFAKPFVEDLDQFLSSLMAASYRRSDLSTNQERNIDYSTRTNMDTDMDIDTFGDSNIGTGSEGNTSQVSEQEGHFWSLLSVLLLASNSSRDGRSIMIASPVSKSRSSRKMKVIMPHQKSPPPSAPTTTISFKLLLWSKKQNYYVNQRQQFDSWLKTLAEEHVNSNSAALTQSIAQSANFFSGHKFNSNHRHDISKGDTILVPELFLRRQVILKWIESCHARSLRGTKLTTGKENKVMWKDTLAQLQFNSKHGTGASILGPNQRENAREKIDNFHPDAPFLLKKKSTNPLYGNDEADEIFILSTCLLLIKAGKFHEALDLCRDRGQPWRAASWGGDAVYGRGAVGNPQRSLWKRTMWTMGRGIFSSLDSRSEIENSTTVSGSLAYEAAITSILADDVTTALRNPILNRDWMDTIWVYFRGIQARYMEQIYHVHNNAKRLLPHARLFPIKGTEFEKEEREQLRCTEDMARIEEGNILYQLQEKFSSLGIAGPSLSNGKNDIIWKKGMSAFMTGVEEVTKFLNQTIPILLQLKDRVPIPLDNGWCLDTEDAVLLRFVTHLLIFLDTLCSTEDSEEDFQLTVFKRLILLRKDEMLPIYVHYLISQKSLWHLVGFYSSLLKQDVMMEITIDFWVSCVEDQQDLCMVLSHAREHYLEGIDLLLLRKVVRLIINHPTIGTDKDEEKEFEAAFPSSFLKISPMKDEMGGDLANKLEEKISRSDIRKMHSIRWLINYPEHFADALLCANMLLRQLLLKTETESPDCVVCDGSDDIKLYTAKVYVSRFLPNDIVNTTTNYSSPDDLNATFEIKRDLTQGIVDEHNSIINYLNAHTLYEEWKEVISATSFIVSTSLSSDQIQYSNSSLEEEINYKMQKKLYKDKKKSVGKSVVKVAEAARQAFLDVLTQDGGWLNHSELHEESKNDEENVNRKQEIDSLQRKCIPNTVFLLLTVLEETAKWMDCFVKDFEEKIGRDDFFHQIEDDEDESGIPSSPFLPERWTQLALLVANFVASDDYHIFECFSGEEMKTFTSMMTENATHLLCYNNQTQWNI